MHFQLVPINDILEILKICSFRTTVMTIVIGTVPSKMGKTGNIETDFRFEMKTRNLDFFTPDIISCWFISANVLRLFGELKYASPFELDFVMPWLLLK